jgi:F-box protein 9
MADSSQANDEDELAKFREQWRQEVQDRARQREIVEHKKPINPPAPSPKVFRKAEEEPIVQRERPRGILDSERKDDEKITSGVLQDEVELARAIGSIQLGGTKVNVDKAQQTRHDVKYTKPHGKPGFGANPLSPKPKHATPAIAKAHIGKEHHVSTTSTKKAVEAYAKAVEHENTGQLNEALHLYRKAFKLDDRVERAYNSAIVKEEERNQAVAEDTQVVDPGLPVTATPPPIEPYVFRTHTQLAPDYHSPARRIARTSGDGDDIHAEWNDPLTRIINKFEEDLFAVDFEPEEEKWPVLLSRLPDEVVENVVFFLDVQSVERFALTCKKARLLTRVAPVWK